MLYMHCATELLSVQVREVANNAITYHHISIDVITYPSVTGLGNQQEYANFTLNP
jgi:hypothetical protein